MTKWMFDNFQTVNKSRAMAVQLDPIDGSMLDMSSLDISGEVEIDSEAFQSGLPASHSTPFKVVPKKKDTDTMYRCEELYLLLRRIFLFLFKQKLNSRVSCSLPVPLRLSHE